MGSLKHGSPDLLSLLLAPKEKTKTSMGGFGLVLARVLAVLVTAADSVGLCIPGPGVGAMGYGPDIWTTNYTQGCVIGRPYDPRTNDLVWTWEGDGHDQGLGPVEKQTDQARRTWSAVLRTAKKVDKKLAKKNA